MAGRKFTNTDSERLQPGMIESSCKSALVTKISRVTKETEALVSDLMVDQPLFWLLAASFIGFFLGKRLLRRN